MDNYMIGLFSMLLIILVSRVLSNNALKKLDKEKKVELLDLFSGKAVYTYIALILIIGFFYACNKLELFSPMINVVIYVCLITLYIVLAAFRSYRILKNNDFPEFYISNYLFTTSLRIVGLVVFFAFMVL
ncbi:hypothetical protein [Fluviicola sp.]|uniref:hypothetical protein n=1 Tax=Fluviicola sp. TaxID=1917219 RepID=UPI0031D24ECA